MFQKWVLKNKKEATIGQLRDYLTLATQECLISPEVLDLFDMSEDKMEGKLCLAMIQISYIDPYADLTKQTVSIKF